MDNNEFLAQQRIHSFNFNKFFTVGQIQLKYDGKEICSGTILNTTFVLFALQCILGKQVSRFTVQASVVTVEEQFPGYGLSSSHSILTRNISRIFTANDDCDDVTNEHDIVTLVLSTPLDFDENPPHVQFAQPERRKIEKPVRKTLQHSITPTGSKKSKTDLKSRRLKVLKEKKSTVLKQTQSTMKMGTELNVVTLNCWGIAGVSKDRIPRMKAIADELGSGKYDFVFLQEVWTNEDYERIKLRTREVLPYSHYFFSGVIGAGICILSKSPIKSAFFYQWALNGYMHKIQHGDWFGGKGIGLVEVEHRGLTVNLYTTHLHAEYDRVNDEYLAHRVIQSYQTAQFISLTSKSADVVLFGGDFNTEPGDLAYRVIVHTAQLRDTFFEVIKSHGIRDESNTCTIDTPGNSYTSASLLKSNPYGKRIDYVVYKSGRNVEVKTLAYEIPWPRRVSGQHFSYSDHEAVVVKLKIEKSSPGPREDFKGGHSEIVEGAAKEALVECIEICTQALKHLQYSRSFYGFAGFLILTLFLLCSSFELSGLMYYLMPLARVLLLLLLCFVIFMGTIWNRIEVHGILSGKLAMELELAKYSQDPIENPREIDSLNVGGGDFANLDVDTIDSDVALF